MLVHSLLDISLCSKAVAIFTVEIGFLKIFGCYFTVLLPRKCKSVFFFFVPSAGLWGYSLAAATAAGSRGGPGGFFLSSVAASSGVTGRGHRVYGVSLVDQELETRWGIDHAMIYGLRWDETRLFRSLESNSCKRQKTADLECFAKRIFVDRCQNI
jgi:hypothetical protein